MTEYAYSYVLDDRYLAAPPEIREMIGKDIAASLKRIADEHGHLYVWPGKIMIVWPRINADMPDEEIKARFAHFIKGVLNGENLVENPIPVFVKRVDKEGACPFPLTRIEVTFNAK